MLDVLPKRNFNPVNAAHRQKIADLVGANTFVDPASEATEDAWDLIIQACEMDISIGLGMLDSFLDGPDLNRRISLIHDEVTSNEWLRAELRDTLSLNQSKNLSLDQIRVLEKLVGLG